MPQKLKDNLLIIIILTIAAFWLWKSYIYKPSLNPRGDVVGNVTGVYFENNKRYVRTPIAVSVSRAKDHVYISSITRPLDDYLGLEEDITSKKELLCHIASLELAGRMAESIKKPGKHHLAKVPKATRCSHFDTFQDAWVLVGEPKARNLIEFDLERKDDKTNGGSCVSVSPEQARALVALLRGALSSATQLRTDSFWDQTTLDEDLSSLNNELETSISKGLGD